MKIRTIKYNKTYGGGQFLDYDTEKNEFCTGNTQSTTQPSNWFDVIVEVNTIRDLVSYGIQLENNNVKNLGRK